MYNINQIIEFCNNFTYNQRNNSFQIEIGKRICKYLNINEYHTDNFYCSIAWFFYKDINDKSVILTRDMFSKKIYYKHCYQDLVSSKNTRCINCIKCYDCTDCINCIDCRECLACENVMLCRDCTLCINCLNCTHCIQSKYLQDEFSFNNQNASFNINN